MEVEVTEPGLDPIGSGLWEVGRNIGLESDFLRKSGQPEGICRTSKELLSVEAFKGYLTTFERLMTVSTDKLSFFPCLDDFWALEGKFDV